MFKSIKQVMALALAATVGTAFGEWDYWQHSGDEWGLWSVEGNWNLTRIPAATDIVGMPRTSGTADAWLTYRMKIDSAAVGGHFWSPCSASQGLNYTSNIVTIVTGGSLTLGGFYFNTASTDTSTKEISDYAELILDGGDMTVTGDNKASSQYKKFLVGSAGRADMMTRLTLKKGTLLIGSVSDTMLGDSSPVEMTIADGATFQAAGVNGGPKFMSAGNANGSFKLEMSGGAFSMKEDGSGSLNLNRGEVILLGGTFKASSVASYNVGDDFAFRILDPTMAITLRYGMTCHGAATLEVAEGASLTSTERPLKLGYVAANTTSVPRSNLAHWGKSVFSGGGTLALSSTSADNSAVNVGDAGFEVKAGTVTAKRINLVPCASFGANGETPTNLLEVSGGTLTVEGTTMAYGSKTGFQRTIYRQTGGSATLGGITYAGTQGGVEAPLVEVSGGYLKTGSFTPTGTVTTNGLTYRIIGGKATALHGDFQYPGDRTGWIPVFMDGVIADGELSPANTYQYTMNVNLSAAIRPLGGFQVTTNETFCQYRKNANATLKDEEVSRFPKGLFQRVDVYALFDLPEMAQYGWPTAKWQNVANWGFVPEEKIESGFTSADGRAWGWCELPGLKHADSAKCAIAKLTVVPKRAGVTVASIAEGIRSAGFNVEVTDAAAGALAVKIPAERLAVGKDRTTKVFFDFTRFESPEAIYNGVRTTDAVVTAFTCSVNSTRGLMLLLK